MSTTNSVFHAIVAKLGLNPADPKFYIGPRAQRILREHQRQADRNSGRGLSIIRDRAIADLSGRSSNDRDDPSREPIFTR